MPKPSRPLRPYSPARWDKPESVNAVIDSARYAEVVFGGNLRI